MQEALERFNPALHLAHGAVIVLGRGDNLTRLEAGSQQILDVLLSLTCFFGHQVVLKGVRSIQRRVEIRAGNELFQVGNFGFDAVARGLRLGIQSLNKGGKLLPNLVKHGN